MRDDFVPRLREYGAANESQQAACNARLTALGIYLDTRKHLTEPEGHTLPERDESSLQQT